MRPKHFWIAMLLAIGGAASSGRSAVSLALLNNPTLQTLIDMGSTPVSVGPYEFSDFSFVDASSGVAHTADQIQVQAHVDNGYGLQFVSSWSAANSGKVDDVITFDVRSPAPAPLIGQISLLSNGAVTVPASGTFAGSTLVSRLPNGSAAAPVLTTYNDGINSPIGTTSPDVNFAETGLFPQPQLHIIDTLIVVSTPTGAGITGGVATVTELQDSFFPVTIPEPTQPAWIFLPMGVVVMTLSRRRWRVTAL